MVITLMVLWQVISKVAQINKLDEELVEESVQEFKFDQLSSQYNMLMDRYTRLRKGTL